MSDRFRSENLLLLGLVLLALLRGVIYASVVPPWQGPDEFRHFHYGRLIAEYGRLVTHVDLYPQLEEEIIASLLQFDYWRFGYWEVPLDPDNPPRQFSDFQPAHAPYIYQAPLYYLVTGFILRPFLGRDAAFQMYVLRFASLLLGALTVVIASLVAHQLFPHDRFMRIGVPAFIALLPMHGFITAMVNNDVLAEFIVSLLLLLSARALLRGLRWPEILAMSTLPILAWYTKRTAVISIPLALATIPFFWLSRGVKVKRSHALAAMTIFAFFLVLLVAKAGSLRALLTRVSPKETYNLLLPDDIVAWLLDPHHFSQQAALVYIESVRIIMESFWARFGWMNVRLGEAWYRMLALVCLLSMVGVVLFAIRLLRGTTKMSRGQIATLFLFAIAAALQLAIVIVGNLRLRELWFPYNVPQGRYCFPVIIPIATLFMLGLRELVSPHHRQRLLVASLVGLLILDLISLLLYILPFYYS